MKKLKIIIPVLAVAIISGFIGINYVLAEQSGSSPESGATSYIKATYDSIVALGHGSVAAGSWGDWGAYWNRIRSAAEWVPSGNAVVDDVVSGKTFNGNSRTQATGTKLVTGPCPTQAYDDGHGTPVTSTTSCSQTWVVDTSVTGAEKKDPVTGLIWSITLLKTGTTVGFSFYDDTTFSWDASAAANTGITAPVAGNRTAVQLCADQGNGWRLPTQKELMQAYIDGSYWNLAMPTSNLWSATQYSDTYAWYVDPVKGSTTFNAKTGAHEMRCVR